MQRRLCAAILVLQAIVLGLTTPVLISVRSVAPATALWAGVGLCVACLLAAGLLRFRMGYWLGWAIQLASLGLGIRLPTMIFLGVIFLGLWAAAYLMGARIERDRAAWERSGNYPGRVG